MPNSAEIIARIVKKETRNWSNKHENYSVPVEGLYDIWNPDVSGSQMLKGYRATTRSLQELISNAVSDGVRLRAIGSAWSISRAMVTDGWLVNTKPLNWVFRLSDSSVSGHYAGDTSNLLFAQCGFSIGDLTRYLTKRGKSLKTSGVSNSQTIAGALSTGTHGSVMEGGAIQDFVKGLHLITGSDRHVWLERASDPVISDEFAEKLGAEIIRDDDTFNAALVSFGVIHGAQIEVEDIYLLEANRIKIPFDDDLKKVMQTLDFDRLDLPRKGVHPYHFEVVINPHAEDGNAFVSVMYKEPYREDYNRRGGSSGKFQPGDDFLCVIGTLLDVVPDAIPKAVNTLLSSQYGECRERNGTLGDIFSSTSIRGKSTGAAIGIPLEDSQRALLAILDVHDTSKPFPRVFACRYIKKSDALLAFTRFDMTCIIDLDAVDSRVTREFYRKVCDEFEKRNIPYTNHCGKANDLTPERVVAMYCDDLQTWLSERRKLLDADSRRVFSSPFTDQCGLSVQVVRKA